MAGKELSEIEKQFMQTVCQRLTGLMRQRNLSLSLMSDLLGISGNTVRKWFDNELISTHHLGMLCEYFDLASVGDLLEQRTGLTDIDIKLAYAKGFVEGALQHHVDPYWGATVRFGNSNLKALEEKWRTVFKPLVDSGALQGEHLVHLVCSLVHYMDSARYQGERTRYAVRAIEEARRLRNLAHVEGRTGRENYWYRLELMLRIDAHGFNLQKLGEWDDSKKILEIALNEVREFGETRDRDYLNIEMLACLWLARMYMQSPRHRDFDRAKRLLDSVEIHEGDLNAFSHIRYIHQRANLAIHQLHWDQALRWLDRGKQLFETHLEIARTENYDNYLSRKIKVLHNLGRTANDPEVQTLFTELRRRHKDADIIGGNWLDGYLNYALMLKEIGRAHEAMTLVDEVEQALNLYSAENRLNLHDAANRAMITQIVGA